ncbi:MAG: hypothetical protein WAO71_13755 [Gallionella sp.]
MTNEPYKIFLLVSSGDCNHEKSYYYPTANGDIPAPEDDSMLLSSFNTLKKAVLELGFAIEIHATNSCQQSFNAMKIMANKPNLIVNVQDSNSSHFSRAFHEYVQLNHETQNIKKIVIEDSFSLENSSKPLLFYPQSNTWHIRKRDFENNSRFIQKLLNTLLNIPPIYISYGNESGEETPVIALKIKNYLGGALPNVSILYDKDLKLGQSIGEYINKLKGGQNIILLINEKYLTSIHCMGEFLGVLECSKNGDDLKAKIHPIILKSAKRFIYDDDPAALLVIEKYWNEKRDELLIALKERGTLPNRQQEKLELINRIIAIMPDFPDILSDYYNLPIETHLESNFAELFWAINIQLEKNGYMNFYNNEKEMNQVLSQTKSRE